MEVQKIDADNWFSFVKGEFDNLLRCKRGKLSAEREEVLGPRPKYSPEECEAIVEREKANLIESALLQVEHLLEEVDFKSVVRGDFEDWVEQYLSLSKILEDLCEKACTHPDVAEWDERRRSLSEQYNLREVVMEKQAKHLIRDFCTGVLAPCQLNQILDEFEATEF